MGDLPIAGPMFESEPSLLSVVPIALAVAGFGIGLLWLRRITRGEPEGGSFRATAAPQRDSAVIVAIVLVVGLVGLAAYALASQ
jgi:hypothetical protein